MAESDESRERAKQRAQEIAPRPRLGRHDCRRAVAWDLGSKSSRRPV